MNWSLGSCIWCVAAFLSTTTLQARAADTTSLGRSLEGLGQKQGWVLEESLRVYEGNGLYVDEAPASTVGLMPGPPPRRAAPRWCERVAPPPRPGAGRG